MYLVSTNLKYKICTKTKVFNCKIQNILKKSIQIRNMKYKNVFKYM